MENEFFTSEDKNLTEDVLQSLPSRPVSDRAEAQMQNAIHNNYLLAMILVELRNKTAYQLELLDSILTEFRLLRKVNEQAAEMIRNNLAS